MSEPPTPDGSESVLIGRVVDGDELAFRELYRLHAAPLYRFALRLTGGGEADAEDLVQETWSRAVRKLSGFEGRAALRSWLMAIATRAAAERYRAELREAGQAGGVKAAPPPHASAHTATSAASAARSITGRIDLERAFAALPVGYRSVLVLHDVEGFRHREIAELLGISVGTSKSQLARARKRLRDTLGDGYARTG